MRPVDANMYTNQHATSRPNIRMPVLPDEVLSDSSEQDLVGIWGCLPFAIGIRRFGVVDHVPGLFYVATLFFHILWFPFVPLKTRLFVFGATDDGRDVAVPLPISIRSILIAWTRAILIILGIVASMVSIGGVFALADKPESLLTVIVSVALAAICFAGFAVSRKYEACSPQRGEHLGLLLGFPHETASRLTELAQEEADLYGQSNSVPCPKCGRQNAPTTRVCPRCEARLV